MERLGIFSKMVRMLSNDEKKRYARQFLLSEIGKEGQQKLKAAKVLIVGAGGLGCPVSQYLAAAGVGRLGIVDADAVSLHNLPRQILYRQGDVGKLKVTVAAQRLQSNNPHCKVKVYAVFLNEENALELFDDYDVIVDCTDNFTARYLIDKTALKLGKTWVYGSILEHQGQVSTFDGAKGQSYRNVFPEEDKQQAASSAYGLLGVLPGFIGCLQANEVLKIICNFGETLSGKLLIYDMKTYKQQVFKL